MVSIIQKLPIELRRLIYVYVRPMQNSELLYNIRNYKYSIDIILDKNRSIHLILNDIWVFLNDFFGDYYKIWERIPKIYNGHKLKFWIGNSYALKDYKSQIKILWGLLTPQERSKFLENYN
tara:strand:- start:73 stop:435 length:363 start_codon:yes stop_codon:yes gene_type:complete